MWSCALGANGNIVHPRLFSPGRHNVKLFNSWSIIYIMMKMFMAILCQQPINQQGTQAVAQLLYWYWSIHEKLCMSECKKIHLGVYYEIKIHSL